MQVRFQSEADKAAEHKRSSRTSAMIPKSELRLEANSATRVGGTRPMRVRSKGSAVISYKPDADGNLVARLFKQPRATSSTRTPKIARKEYIPPPAQRTAADVAALIGIPAPKHDKKFDHDYNSH